VSGPCEKCPCPDICLRRPTYCEWAAKDPPVPVEIRHICGRSAREHGNYPPIAEQAANLGHAFFAWATSGFAMATEGERAARLFICAYCEHWDASDRRCRLCGCYTDAKIALKTEHCPINKW
jgi:hypothetical protein